MQEENELLFSEKGYVLVRLPEFKSLSSRLNEICTLLGKSEKLGERLLFDLRGYTTFSNEQDLSVIIDFFTAVLNANLPIKAAPSPTIAALIDENLKLDLSPLTLLAQKKGLSIRTFSSIGRAQDWLRDPHVK